MGQPARQLESVQEAVSEPTASQSFSTDTIDHFEEAMQDESCTWEAYMAEVEAKNGGPIVLPKELEEQLEAELKRMGL